MGDVWRELRAKVPKAIDNSNQIATFFDAELQEALAPTSPSLLNHSLGCRCDATYNIHNIAEKLERLLADKKLHHQGSCSTRQLRAAERRRMWQVFWSKIDNIKVHLADDKWAKCESSMSLYSMPTFDLVGEVKQGSNGAHRLWNAKGCRILGLDENGNFKEQRGATRHAGGPAGDAQPAGMEDIAVDGN